MESDFINIVNDLMREKEADLPTRLDCQEAALDELPCNNPTLGKWFEDNSVSYVLSAFNLSDQDFASVFPTLKHLTAAQRQDITRTFEEHIQHCPRCGRRQSFELEFEERLESTLNQHREHLLAELKCENEEPAEGKQVIDGKARFAHKS